MNRKIGDEIDHENYKKLHNSISLFLEAFRPVLDNCDQIYEDIVAKALLDDNNEITEQLETVNKLNKLVSDVFIPNFIKLVQLEEKLTK
jgi:hypothetical protein